MWPFTWLLDRIGGFLDWVCRQRQGAADRRNVQVESRRELLRSTLDPLTVAMQRIEYDWKHGLDSAQREAEDAAFEAEALAQQVPDDEARRLVLEWKAAFDAAPHGWKEGSTPQAMAVRDAHRKAVARLGELIRGGEVTRK